MKLEHQGSNHALEGFVNCTIFFLPLYPKVSRKRRKSHGETSNSHHEFSLPKTKRSGQSSSAAATDNGDNVSESGTYTIDSDNPSKEVLEARQNIDEVFGIAKDITSDEDTDKDVSDEEIAEQVVESKSKVGHNSFYPVEMCLVEKMDTMNNGGQCCNTTVGFNLQSVDRQVYAVERMSISKCIIIEMS